MKFRIEVKEVHSAELVIEADSRKEALEKANAMIEAEEVKTSYAYTMDEDDWNVTTD